ncbi:uncharacterized protein FIBRA_01844 [Fibroporia radiculosa]|uniref:Beta-lactamase-related domain-containing protein n=1 Tax=Fibroporia radiculosa TaxID=599839 RepID=J4GLJ0_9APHY|nr:uncharacterized protein FIBRA_01844 [Fibroporia radiculosa]CCL99820.1 predicted protein [Fibroporia radiculosa]
MLNFKLSGRILVLASAVTLGVALRSVNEQVPLGSGLRHTYPLSNAKTAGNRVITPELSVFIESVLKNATISGISIGVVQLIDGREPVVELDSWGRQTEEGDGHDLTPDALFNLASCSKAFLASSVGLLMDDYAQGRNVTPLPPGVTRFDWDTKLAEMLPGEWGLEDEWASMKTNFRDALSHVTGMPRHDYSYAPGDTSGSVVRNLRNLRPAYELRQRYSYNNQMFTTGSYVVKKYSNMSYMDFATSRLFAPMGMSSTTFWPEEAANSGKLTQTWTKFGRRIPFWFTDEVVDLMAGAGGVISSAQDMTKWLSVLLNSGVDPVSNTTILPRSVFDEITTAHTIMKGTPDSPEISVAGYGLGWMRFSYQGHDIITHTGAIPGISTRVAFLPADGLGFVILANGDEKAAANEVIAYRIIEDVLGLPRIDRVLGTNSRGQATRVDCMDGYVTAPAADSAMAAGRALSANLSAYAGTYTNPGYGALTLCAPTSDSHYCSFVLSDFAPLDKNIKTRTNLYATWPRIWSQSVRMVHQDADTFGLELTAVFPHGYGANSSAFETLETGEGEGRAVFVVEDFPGDVKKVKGFGLILDTDAVAARARDHTAVEEIADAWFAKV